MKYSAAAVLAFATAVLARPKFTNTNFDIVEGEPFELKWMDAQGAVTIELMTGPDKDRLKPAGTLASTTGETGSFTFTPSDLGTGSYAFRITDESGDPANYSILWAYEGTAPVSSSVSSSASVTTSAETSTETEETSTVTTGTETSTDVETSTSASTLETSTIPPTSTRRPQVEETAPPNTNNGQRFASSLALVLGTVAALVFFN